MIAYLLDVPTWGSATLFELMWLVAGLVALIVGVGNIVDAYRDLLSLPKVPPGCRYPVRREMLEIIARGNIMDEVYRLVIAALIVWTGIAGVVTPNPIGGNSTLTGLAITVSLVAIAATSALRGIIHTRRRHRLYDLAEVELTGTRRRTTPPEGITSPEKREPRDTQPDRP